MIVAAGCPVRRRAWILPAYLRALERLVVPAGVELRYHLVVQPGPDATQAIVSSWCAADPARRSWGLCTGAPAGWHRQAGPEHYDYAWLALLRNVLARQAAGGWLLSVDSDVLASPSLLCRLLGPGDQLVGPGDVVGAPVSNTPGVELGDPRASGNWEDLPGAPPGLPAARREVAWTGACALYGPRALAVGWRAHPRGEDVGLCAALRRLGGRVYIEPAAAARHVMRPEDLPAALAARAG